MLSLGLAIITNNLEETEKLINSYSPYFDKLYITVADKDKAVYDQLKAKLEHPSSLLNHALEKVELSYFEWVDSFGKARLYNQEQVKTDYFMWMDTDDTITNPENLRAIAEGMESKGVDITFMIYDYYRNDHGEQQANHWRERIIRTSSDCKWEDVPVHETIPAKGVAQNVDTCTVEQHKPIEQMLKSMDRNQRLLEKDWETHKDPRTAFYLGMTYAYHQEQDKALEMFTFMVENGGWDEQKVTVWNLIADVRIAKQQFEEAIDATDEAIKLDPSHPDAYYHKVLIYTQMKQYDKAAVWADVALTKKPRDDTMQLVDPTRYTYRGLFLAAQANLYVGRPDRAFEFYNRVADTAPHFIRQMTAETGVDWARTFAESYNDHNAINAVKYLTSFLKDKDGKLHNLFQALPPRLAHDPRLSAERQLSMPPHKWPEKSIVVYCGPGLEEWGPDTVKDGLGGSEEAWVYLSRELTKLGYSVTIYGERNEEYRDRLKGTLWEASFSVTYKPWSEFQPYDEFDTFVAWRQPRFVQNIKAKKKIIDLHDTIDPDAVGQFIDDVDMVMVKSDYHRSLYPNVPDEKIRVVTNGIFEDLNYE